MTGRPWSPSEIQELYKRYPENHARDVARLLERSTESILAKAGRLGIQKSPSFMAHAAYETGKRFARRRGDKLWSDEERSKLASLFPLCPNAELADTLDCSEAAVRDQAHLMGLKKSVFGSLAQKRGKEGEEMAKRFFLHHGFQILEAGKNRGNTAGCDAYDYIVISPEGKRIAVNVKYAHSTLHIHPTNLHRLFSLQLPVAFLLITDSDGFFWADVRKI